MVDLSVIVPVYNAESTLARCVDSVLASDLYRDRAAELILVNDGSTDGSAAICEEYAGMERVSFVNGENGGVAVARNRGVAAANGRFVTFLDNDDYVAPDYHAQAIAPLVGDDSVVLSIAGYTTVSGERETAKRPTTEELEPAEVPRRITRLIREGVFNPVWNKVYRADVINRLGVRFEEGRKNAEDLLFNLDYLRVGGGVSTVDAAGLFWVREASSAAHALEDRYTELHELETSIAYRRDLTQRLLDLGVPTGDVDEYFRTKDNTWFYLMVKNIINPGTPYAPREQLTQIRKVMEFKPARDNILSGRSRSRLPVLNRTLYRLRSPRLARATFRRL